VHIQGINTEIVSSQIDTFKDFSQSQMLPITEEDHLIGGFAHFALDKTKQMLLVHTRRVMNVSVNLSDVVKVTVGDFLAVCNFLIFIQEGVQLILAFQVGETLEGKALGRSVRRDIHHGI
jgi:EAL domain-containing protein (putative c-di-GMP-specific phosphodiesterase class I)